MKKLNLINPFNLKESLKKFDIFFSKLKVRERWLIFIALFFATFIFPLQIIYSPILKNNRELKNKINNLQIELKTKEAQMELLKIKPEKKSEEKEFQKFSDLPELLSFLGELARKHRIKILSFNPTEEKTKKTDEVKEKEITGIISVKLEMSGVYESYFNFFKELSNTNYLLGVQSLVFKNDSEKYPFIPVKVVLVAQLL